jgi:tetratricopeptide (TPR) repeat protein
MVRMEVVLQITRLTDGKILWNQRLRSQTTGSREAIDAEPAEIDADLLRSEAQGEITSDFMRRIMPSEELTPVTFLTDGDIPDLEKGIKEAKKGKWEDAILLFSRAAESASGLETVHKAWFDLGVAHQYNYDFRKAEEALKKAISLKEQTLYKHQLDYCYDMEREYQEVLKQQQEAE